VADVLIDEYVAVLAISQSGETAVTLEAICEGKSKGVLMFGIINAVDSTKVFISQLTVLALLALVLGRKCICRSRRGT
jgi:glucosamine 6-phosphate synthetase-like amidotransferase/phosphosugar isomerase protein